MAHENLRWYHELKESSPYSGTRRALHLEMGMRADKSTGVFHATQATLGNRVGCSERRVRELISEMSRGIARIGGRKIDVPVTIEVLQRGREGHAGTYRLLGPTEWTIGGQPYIHEPSQSDVAAGPRSHLGGTASSTGGSAYVSDANPPPIPSSPSSSLPIAGGIVATASGGDEHAPKDWDDIPPEWEPYAAYARSVLEDDALGPLEEWAPILAALANENVQLQRPLAIDPDGPLMFGLDGKTMWPAEIDFWNQVQYEFLALLIGPDMDFWDDFVRDPSLMLQTRRDERAADPVAYRESLDKRDAIVV